MDSKFGLRNAREQSRARKKILRTLLTEQSDGNVMDVQGFVKLFRGDGVIRAGVNPSFSTRGVGEPGSRSRWTSWSKGLYHRSGVLDETT